VLTRNELASGDVTAADRVDQEAYGVIGIERVPRSQDHILWVLNPHAAHDERLARDRSGVYAHPCGPRDMQWLSTDHVDATWQLIAQTPQSRSRKTSDRNSIVCP
jgi:hypothetical protein